MNDSLFEEIKTDELYHLYKTNSPQINTELSKKFKEYPVIKDFFKHYTNIDIKTFNENINIFLFQMSSITDINSLNTFQSSIDQYITDFSQLYIALKAICKINESIEKIITKIKISLPLLYSKHNLDKDCQNKINEITTRYMLNSNFVKGNFSSTSTLENSENSKYSRPKSNKLLNIEKIELLKDLLKKDNGNNTIYNSINTPRFIDEDNSSINSEDMSIQKEENEQKELKKMNSIDSRFTFKNQITDKEKIEKKENIENENCNGTTVDINDYITSIPKDVLFPNIKHRRKYESYKNLNEINSLCNKVKDFQLHDEDLKPIYESSEKIVINEDSKMYADLLEIIYELYKNKKINYEQKVKLKKLIIQKCPKILHVYKCFQNVDSEKLINGLKELI